MCIVRIQLIGGEIENVVLVINFRFSVININVKFMCMCRRTQFSLKSITFFVSAPRIDNLLSLVKTIKSAVLNVESLWIMGRDRKRKNYINWMTCRVNFPGIRKSQFIWMYVKNFYNVLFTTLLANCTGQKYVNLENLCHWV